MTTVHVALVLDRSGSMESSRDATISGFNEYIGEIRRTAEREELTTLVSLTTFNHEVAVQYVDGPLSRLKPLTRKSYVPGGMTAMLDAVGETLKRLEPMQGEGHSFLVCVISDGYENASTHYSYPDIAERIQRLTARGTWTFTYLGANQDLSQVSEALHIPQGNIAAYAASPAGTSDAWDRHGKQTARHLRAVAASAPAPSDFYKAENEPDTKR